jgi:hypothetical protein
VGIRRVVTAGLAATSLIVALFGSCLPAFACSCAVAPSVGSPGASYQVVFLGRVQKVVPSASSPDVNLVVFATLDGGDQFGSVTRSVVTPASEAACGYPFIVGTTYEVRANANADGALVTDACSGTQLSNRSLPRVGYPTDPVPQRPGDVAILIGLAVIVAMTTGGIVVLQRLLRR